MLTLTRAEGIRLVSDYRYEPTFRPNGWRWENHGGAGGPNPFDEYGRPGCACILIIGNRASLRPCRKHATPQPWDGRGAEKTGIASWIGQGAADKEKKLRRRVEDALRKTASMEDLLAVAALLGVKTE